MNAKRLRRHDFVVPHCTEVCPAGVDVPRYIRAIKKGKYDESVAVLREKIPFPTVCADSCFAPCEDVCAYRQFGDPVAIRALKRAAVDKGSDTWKKMKKVADKTDKRVAIIGSGPAGLTAAYYLVTLGHEIIVFDSFPKPGGMMRYGIPNYRLPEDRLDKDISNILEWGVTFRGNTTIGNNIKISQLKKDFDAIFVASGANSSAKIRLEGSDKNGVLWGWEFLRDVTFGKKFDFKGNVIVVGGGNVAIDAALTAKRIGTKDVHIVCLERREEMPAHEWEIDRAKEEGIFMHNSWAPKKVLGEESVTGLGMMKCTSVFDKSSNFKPTYDEEITSRVEGNHIIIAIGQVPELAFLDKLKNIKIDGERRIEVGEKDLATAEKGLFAGGDVVREPGSIISAIAYGRKAAAAIDKYLGGRGDIEEVLATPEDEVLLPEFAAKVKPRNDMALLEPVERLLSFDQTEMGLSDEQILAESSRCLNCDARQFQVTVYSENCKECGYCIEVCGLDIFTSVNYFNNKGYKPVESKNSDRCVGCLQCFYACPDYAIDVKEACS
jgi:NADPH-dependent glutamate synthase beta subunit-like oxidoreductase/ferredoxin